MENKLTPYEALANNVIRTTADFEINPVPFNMETNWEEIKAPVTPEVPEEIEEDELKFEKELTQDQKDAKKIWKRILDKKKEGGRELTPEDIELARKAIEKGEGPTVGGASDGFESLHEEDYAGTVIEPYVKALKAAGERGDVPQRALDDLIRRAESVVVADDDIRLLDRFKGEVNGITTRARARMGGGGGVATIKDLIQQRLDVAAEKKENRSANPQSIQELAQVIISEEGDEIWGPDGIYPLLEIILDENGNPKFRTKRNGEFLTNERGDLVPQLEVNQTNLIKWFRERMMYQHTNNSRDSKLAMTSLVGIINEYGSTTSIYTMDQQKGRYFRDENTGTVYTALAEHMKGELWLFGNMRNYDLMYQEAMGSDSELPKLIGGIHNLEEITRPGSLELIMSLSKNHGETGDTAIGDGIRKAYEIYFNISDFDELQKILGKDSPIFTREGFVKALKIVEGKEASAEEKDLSENAKELIKKVFSKNGSELDPLKFVDEINPFNAKNKGEFNIKVTRELVKLVLSGKYGFDYGLQYSPEKKKTIVNGKEKEVQSDRVYHRNDLEYAETWAWVLTRWTGAAARNDTQAIGFDALTKAMKVQAYRVRQASETRAASYGNEYDLPVLKSLISDFFNGIFVEKDAVDGGKNLTPYEVFGEIDKYDDVERRIAAIRNGRTDKELSDSEIEEIKSLKKEKENWIKRLKFEQFTQRGLLGDHINRGFEVFHSTMGAEELRLEEIVKWDPFRGTIMDRGKFEEQVKEKFLKPLRYEFATYDKIDFSKKTRVQVGGFKSGEMPIYKEITNAEKFFGPEVLQAVKLKALKDPKFTALLESGKSHEEAWLAYIAKDGRQLFWKQAAMMRMAAHIRSHRQFGNGYTPLTAGMVEMFYDALESIRAVDVGEGEDGTEINYKARFLSKEDIEWIRKYSGTTRKSLFIKDFMVKDTGGSLAKGIWGAIEMMFKEATR